MIKAYIIDRDRVLSTLSLLSSYNDKNKAITEGLRKASRILIYAGKRSLLLSNKKKTGNLYRSISFIIKKMKAGSIVGFGNKGHHAHLVDLGTSSRKTKEGYNRGSYQGSLFWTNTVNSNAHKVYNTLYESIELSILKLMRR